MKPLIKQMTVICLCLWPGIIVQAQIDPFAVMQKICAAYKSGTPLRFYGSMSMYLKSNPDNIIEKMHSSYMVDGTNFICSIGPLELLSNDTYYVSADKMAKLIMIGHKKDLANGKQIPVLNADRFKKWIKEKRVQAVVIPGYTRSVLKLTDSGGETGYYLYKIEYDNGTGYMKQVLLETADPNDTSRKTMVLKITYTTPVARQKDNNTFSEQHFFSITANKVQLAPAYRGYQLINQL
ncbi:MAG: hypothetical protein ABI813_15425 [Bacteroidota bacterium]